MNRRELIRNLVAASIYPLFCSPAQASGKEKAVPPSLIRIILPPDKGLLAGYKHKYEQKRILRAVLEYLAENYSGRRLPVWGKQFEDIDLEKRLQRIINLVMLGTEKYKDIYPVDPVWILAQIMVESFYYEFAVSWSFAVGVCQFIAETASNYGMITADKSKVQVDAQHMPELAQEYAAYHSLRRIRRKLINNYKDLFYQENRLLKECLSALAHNQSMPKAEEYMRVLQKKKELDKRIRKAMVNYRTYLRVNFMNRDIFNQKDRQFLVRFDQRVMHEQPVLAMIKMMSTHLRARQGNMLTATAGYNAGLSSTWYSSREYKPYGKLPLYRETINYISRILIKHHEIAKRI